MGSEEEEENKEKVGQTQFEELIARIESSVQQTLGDEFEGDLKFEESLDVLDCY